MTRLLQIRKGPESTTLILESLFDYKGTQLHTWEAVASLPGAYSVTVEMMAEVVSRVLMCPVQRKEIYDK